MPSTIQGRYDNSFPVGDAQEHPRALRQQFSWRWCPRTSKGVTTTVLLAVMPKTIQGRYDNSFPVGDAQDYPRALRQQFSWRWCPKPSKDVTQTVFLSVMPKTIQGRYVNSSSSSRKRSWCHLQPPNLQVHLFATMVWKSGANLSYILLSVCVPLRTGMDLSFKTNLTLCLYHCEVAHSRSTEPYGGKNVLGVQQYIRYTAISY
jgi:hypothetical protein